MSRRAWFPLACFGIGLSASVAWSCAGDCRCAPAEWTPALLPIALILPYSDPPPEPPDGLSEGSVEVTATQVLVRYSGEAGAYTVTYAVGEPTTHGFIPSSAVSQ